MKRLAVLLLLVVACGDPVGDTFGPWTKIDETIWYADIALPNGQTIPCLAWTGGGSPRGGLSCDWSDR